MNGLNGGYRPSDRIARIWARTRPQPDEMFLPVLRPYLYLEGWTDAEGSSLPVRNAAALCRVIDEMPPLLFTDDVLVGESGDPQCDGMSNFWPQRPEDWRERVDASSLTLERKARMMAMLEARPFDYQRLAPIGPWPDELKLAQEHGVVSVWGTDLNHSIRGYEKVLRLGFAGLREQVESALRDVPFTDPCASVKRANLIAFQKICASAERLGERHAARARETAAPCVGAEQAEWEKVAQICERVPAQPARTFCEAVQSLWFAHMITTWEDGINANGIGRIDQILWPYLERDLAAGETTWEEAADVLAALWIKLYRPYDVQQMMIGGQHPDGSDASNPLSYLVLDVTEGLGFIRCLSARLHRGSPRALVARCVDLVAKGGGIPFFFNDEALVPALVSRGIPVEDARGYAAIGCVEITIPGKANPHAVSNWINVAKCLELALYDGRDLLDDVQVGQRTGSLPDHPSVEAVLSAYRTQLEYFAELAVYGSNACEIEHRNQYRLPYLSLLTDDCVKKGLDILDGGARYNYHCSAAMGIPNAADSLAALKVAVYDERKIAPEELLRALKADFKDDEVMRLLLRNRLPKYGNDDPLPDGFAADLVRQYCDLMATFKTVSGGTFFCHLFTFVLMLGHGKLTGASPEGRHAGDPLAYSVSPVQGRDTEGVTAVMNSLARLPHDVAAASSSAIVELDPTLLQGPSREAFVDLMIAAVDKGVGQLQFNVVDAETLRAAQDDPDRYRNLCVRVSGFSQQFRLLDREMQEHIIARTKHKH
jgi:formate C-acetyltransferase